MKNKETGYIQETYFENWRLEASLDEWSLKATDKLMETNEWMKKPRAQEQMKQIKRKANEEIGLFIGQRGMRNKAMRLFKTTNTKAPPVT